MAPFAPEYPSCSAWMGKNCRFARKSRIDWPTVIERIRDGVRIPSIANELGISSRHLRRSIVNRFSNPDSAHYNPEIMSRVEDNNSSLMGKLDWSKVREMVNDGESAGAIAREMDISPSYFSRLFKQRYEGDERLMEKLKSNRPKPSAPIEQPVPNPDPIPEPVAFSPPAPEPEAALMPEPEPALQLAWVRKNCRFAQEVEQAMPHLEVVDPETDEKTFFDAHMEYLGTDMTPPGWDAGQWRYYTNFVKKYYGTEDKNEIMRRMQWDEEVPIWNAERGAINFTRRPEAPVQIQRDPSVAWLAGNCKFADGEGAATMDRLMRDFPELFTPKKKEPEAPVQVQRPDIQPDTSGPFDLGAVQQHYGAWVSPEGEIYYVGQGQHPQVARKILGWESLPEDEYGQEDMGAYSAAPDPYDALFDEGWIGAFFGSDHIGIRVDNIEARAPQIIKLLSGYDGSASLIIDSFVPNDQGGRKYKPGAMETTVGQFRAVFDPNATYRDVLQRGGPGDIWTKDDPSGFSAYESRKRWISKTS